MISSLLSRFVIEQTPVPGFFITKNIDSFIQHKFSEFIFFAKSQVRWIETQISWLFKLLWWKYEPGARTRAQEYLNDTYHHYYLFESSINYMIILYICIIIKNKDHGKSTLYNRRYIDRRMAVWFLFLSCRRYHTHPACNCSYCYYFKSNPGKKNSIIAVTTFPPGLLSWMNRMYINYNGQTL